VNGAPPHHLRVVVLGLSLSSSWGNGHATTWRALLKAFAERGHDVLFLERDVPWYAAHRDLPEPEFCRLALYPDLAGLEAHRDAIAEADAVVVGSYVPEGVAVGRLAQEWARGATAFYDIDTPVTLAKLARGDEEYLSAESIPGFDLYLSFTGGPTLDLLERRYGARSARALFCSVDPAIYRPLPDALLRWDLSYLGTYSADRQPALERLLIEPARRAPERRFVVAGPQYPAAIDWPANVERIEHVPPADHPAFYAASRFTLNVTRADMVRAGHSPSVRLFEAAACGTPLLSDTWDGLDAILAPGAEIALVETPEEVGAVLGWPEERRRSVARAARGRVLAGHTAAHRAGELETHLRAAMARPRTARRRVATGARTADAQVSY
jgi:spore maturation protein CgeB